MNIEKVSKYVTVRSGVSEAQGAQRRVLMSLARVRWLEAQSDYEPWPPLKEPDPEPDTDAAPAPKRYELRPQLRNNELSERQKIAHNLHAGGLSVKQIGEKMGISSNAASKLLAQAREKMGIGLR